MLAIAITAIFAAVAPAQEVIEESEDQVVLYEDLEEITESQEIVFDDQVSSDCESLFEEE